MAWVQGYVNWCNILWKNVGPQQAEMAGERNVGLDTCVTCQQKTVVGSM